MDSFTVIQQFKREGLNINKMSAAAVVEKITEAFNRSYEQQIDEMEYLDLIEKYQNDKNKLEDLQKNIQNGLYQIFKMDMETVKRYNTGHTKQLRELIYEAEYRKNALLKLETRVQAIMQIKASIKAEGKD